MGVLHHIKSTIDFILFVLTLLGFKWVKYVGIHLGFQNPPIMNNNLNQNNSKA